MKAQHGYRGGITCERSGGIPERSAIPLISQQVLVNVNLTDFRS